MVIVAAVLVLLALATYPGPERNPCPRGSHVDALQVHLRRGGARFVGYRDWSK